MIKVTVNVSAAYHSIKRFYMEQALLALCCLDVVTDGTKGRNLFHDLLIRVDIFVEWDESF